MNFLLKIFLMNLIPIITGVLVTKKGKPYNVILTSIHKIASLAVVIVTVIMFIDFIDASPLGTTGWIFAILSSLSYLVVMGTGGKLTHKEEGNERIVIVHKIATILLMVSIFLTLY